MRFLFVDEITELEPSNIKGRIRFSTSAPLTVQDKAGNRRIASGLIGEALGQLVSWKIVKDSNFKVRPVYLFSEKFEVLEAVYPGDTVDLVGTICELNDETVTFSGEAFVSGRLVQRLERCTNYFMPIEEVEDPEEVRERFAAICAPGGAPLLDASEPVHLANFILSQKSDDDGSTTFHCKIPAKTPIYGDHFPRRPITPIVVLIEMMGLAAQRLAPANSRLTAREVGRMKIKSFVSPEEDFYIKILSGSSNDGTFKASIELIKSSKLILRGNHVYNIHPGS